MKTKTIPAWPVAGQIFRWPATPYGSVMLPDGRIVDRLTPIYVPSEASSDVHKSILSQNR